jgi:PleD family two-component response regulator
VDPSLLDRKRIRGILEAAGHQVTELDSPERALAHLATTSRGAYRLIVTEIAFPDADGLAFIRKLRSHEGTSSTPVVVVSSHSEKEEIFAAIQAGASHMVSKPFGGDLLLRRVTETLAESQAARQGEDGSLSWRITDYLARELKRADRLGSPLSVLVGRVTPKEAIEAAMAAIRRMMRASDILSRLGEDGLVLILPDTDAPGSRVVEDRLLRAVQALSKAEGNRPPLRVELRLGSATYPADGPDSETLLHLAGERSAS